MTEELEKDTALSDVDTDSSEVQQNKNNKIFKIAVIVIIVLASLNIIFQIYRRAQKEMSTLSKSSFSDSDTELIESKIGITVPEKAYISEAELSEDSGYLKLWITGIENCDDFISQCTEYDKDTYESLNRGQYGASRYYSIVAEGESQPTECYIYKNSGDENWTAYIIDNEADVASVKSIF